MPPERLPAGWKWVKKPAWCAQAQRAARNDIIVLTDHATLRVAGIFPHEGREAYFGFWETTDDLALN